MTERVNDITHAILNISKFRIAYSSDLLLEGSALLAQMLNLNVHLVDAHILTR